MMELIAAIPLVGGLLATLLPFVVVLGIVVFIHEFGHYIVGRWCGIEAEVFSLGFGKEIWHRMDKRGTRWRIGILPLGGYVKFLGDADGSSRPDRNTIDQLAEDERSRSFPGAALWKRALTVAAGPVANFLLSIVIYSGLVLSSGVGVEEPRLGELPASVAAEVPLEEGDLVLAVNGDPVESFVDLVVYVAELESGTSIQFLVDRNGEELLLDVPLLQAPFVAGIRPLSAASRAGIEPGDLIVAADGAPLPDFDTLKDAVAAKAGEEMVITVRRGDERMDLTMVPTIEDVQEPDGTFVRRPIIGVSLSGYLEPAIESAGFVRALGIGVDRTWGVVSATFEGIGQMFAGNVSPTNLQGPVGIAQVSGETASYGLTSFILLVALISTAIGLMNLMPVPVLDGGHLVFYAIEAVTGRPAQGKWVDVAMAIGIAMVLSLMLFATYNDLTRL
ncbi:RIP metalloprotease RseP [Pontivivens insulae]|uniref:Zinc metalloprotease n=1 Tax=Pontivivens insulae TaxID=1639689 RepID=A0A2R8AAQ1_9RHOB|nr:RIP metalloprotease RseP [Pontivivens insulae]RED13212.1 regulator of sigma E protease [Pontivivens insulae]SPF29304.1 Regulator of sigma-E protease RseP [Pontivivens insulae]